VGSRTDAPLASMHPGPGPCRISRGCPSACRGTGAQLGAAN